MSDDPRIWSTQDILEIITADIARIVIDYADNPVVWGPVLEDYKSLRRDFECKLNKELLQQQSLATL